MPDFKNEIGEEFQEYDYYIPHPSEHNAINIDFDTTDIIFTKGPTACTLVQITDKKYLILPSRPNRPFRNNNIPDSLKTISKLKRIYTKDIPSLNPETRYCKFEGENGYLGFFRDSKKEMIVDKEEAAKIKEHLLSRMK